MQNRKNIFIVFLISFSIFSCQSVDNLSKDELCGSIFSESQSVSDYTKLDVVTTLHCNGTYTSGYTLNDFAFSSAGYSADLSNYRNNIKGVWEVVPSPNDDLINAVKTYGLNDNYTIIKYKPNDGSYLYALYYKIEGSNTITLTHFNTNNKEYKNGGEMGMWFADKKN